MLVLSRRGLALSVVVALGACAGPSGAVSVPATDSAQAPDPGGSLDAVLDAAPQAGNGHLLIHKLSVRPDATAPATLMNFVADGPNEGGVPCIDCVNGASSSDNIGMTGPTSYVLSNRYWQYALSFTDVKYKGKCRLAWAITAGKKTVDSFSTTVDLPASAEGGFVLYAISRARPKYSGSATLTGKYTCGKESASQQAPLWFQ